MRIHRLPFPGARTLPALALLGALFALSAPRAPSQESAASDKRLTPKDADRMVSIRAETLSGDGRWLGWIQQEGGGRRGPPSELGGEEEERAERRKAELILANLETGERITVQDASTVSFSPDARWVIYTVRDRTQYRDAAEKKPEGEKKAEEPKTESKPAEEKPAAETKPAAEALKEEGAGKPATGEGAQGAAPAPAPESTTVSEPRPAATGEGERPGGERSSGRRFGRRGQRGRGGETQAGVTPAGATGATTPDERPRETWRARGNTVVVRELGTGQSLSIAHVESHHVTKDSKHLVLVLAPEKEEECGIWVRDLGSLFDGEPRALRKGKGRYSNLTWSKDGRHLSFFANPVPAGEKPDAAPPVTTPPVEIPIVAVPEAKAPALGEKPAAVTTPAKLEETPAAVKTEGAGTKAAPEKTAAKEPPAPPARLYTWDRETDALREVLGPEAPGLPAGHEISRGNARWNADRTKVFVTVRKASDRTDGSAEEGEGREITLPGGRTITAPAGRGREPEGNRGRGRPEAGRGAIGGGGSGGAGTTAAPAEDKVKVEVWHWKDQKIVPMKERDRGGAPGTLFVADAATGALRPLGDERIPNLNLNETGAFGVATDEDPYQAEVTWDRGYQDYYVVDVATGARRVLGRHAPRAPQWSADGGFLLWFENGAWQKIDPATLARTNLTAATDIHYEVGEHPEDATGSVGRVLPGGREVLVSDGFDLWAVPLDGAPGRNLTRTGGREKVRWRHVVLDDDAPFFDDDRAMVLSFTDDATKAEGFARLDLESGRIDRWLRLDKDLGNPKKAENSDRWVLTVQDAHQPSDLWVAGAGLSGLKKISDANPWLKDYELPRAELVSWRSADGEPLKGILMKPVGYEEGRRYPMIVYMYEKLSQGLHQFRSPGQNLNPQIWAQQGYAVLMPDIVYQIGRPGMSSVKCVVPAVQRMIDDGVADPAKVGLCGHSWGGYETAYIITQTRLFSAAIAGAPVANMVSAYNGIRWSTGLPRQFQYERTQSRIGGTLWEYPERFVENSPVFHLPNVTTPVLIMFGNNDGAVPWWQGIEFYLGMRRLGKQAVLLEYQEEGHGLRGKANQEDYTKRTLEWFDHHLKGAPPAEWIRGPATPAPLSDAPSAPPVAGDPAR